jgi:hypothetical protein
MLFGGPTACTCLHLLILNLRIRSRKGAVGGLSQSGRPE